MDKTYNGWSNYETWNANLWTSNDQSSQSYWTERAEACVKDADGDKDEAAEALAQEMESECDERLGDVEGINGMFTDFLRVALAEINWQEIAAQYCDDVEVESEGA